MRLRDLGFQRGPRMRWQPQGPEIGGREPGYRTPKKKSGESRERRGWKGIMLRQDSRFGPLPTRLASLIHQGRRGVDAQVR